MHFCAYLKFKIELKGLRTIKHFVDIENVFPIKENICKSTTTSNYYIAFKKGL